MAHLKLLFLSRDCNYTAGNAGTEQGLKHSSTAEIHSHAIGQNTERGAKSLFRWVYTTCTIMSFNSLGGSPGKFNIQYGQFQPKQIHMNAHRARQLQPSLSTALQVV